jgi:hypothetical protein
VVGRVNRVREGYNGGGVGRGVDGDNRDKIIREDDRGKGEKSREGLGGGRSGNGIV